MDCNVIHDLLPLYIDACCSEESARIVEEHVECCNACRKLLEEMKVPTEIYSVTESPKKFCRLSEWKASVLQSVLLFVSFALITVGVSLEAQIPSGLMNGFWALSLVVPSTAFLLSLANWYFMRLYKNRKSFSNCSFLITLAIAVCAYIWAFFHYEINLYLSEINFIEELISGGLNYLLLLCGVGIFLTAVFCVLSEVLSNKYAKMLGKE